jgi:hypothetical protein
VLDNRAGAQDLAHNRSRDAVHDPVVELWRIAQAQGDKPQKMIAIGVVQDGGGAENGVQLIVGQA